VTGSDSNAALRPDADFVLLQQALYGEYSLERELGRGGMGIVYLAREVALDRPVALKVLPPALAARDDIRERFLREARTAAQLSHPNVVPIFRAEERGGYAYFTMAFVDGESLGQRVRRLGPLAPPAAAKIFREVAWALGYAHSRGIVHRDIKPDNILLDRDSGRALVTDFGIAHLATEGSSLTESGMVLGSAHFMSPEQASGEKMDGRSDLYSLGVTAWFALTGNLPFDAETVQAIMAQQITKPAPPLDVAGAPPSLCSAIDRLLAKSRDARFATGEELAEALADAERGAAPIPAAIRLWINRRNEHRTGMILLDYLLFIFAELQFIANLQMHRPFHILEYSWLLFAPVIQLMQLVADTRPALQAGFDVDDLCRGLLGEAATRLEERHVEETYAKSRVGRWFRRASVAGFAASFLGVLFLPQSLMTSQLLGAVTAIPLIVGIFAGVVSGFFPGDVPTSRFARLAERLTLRFWEGWGGRTISAVARIGVHARVASTSHRNTEAVIALAIGDLMKGLPAEVRRQFPEMPDVVSRLEHEAVTLRANLANLERAVTQVMLPASSASSATDDAERSAIAADLTAKRDATKRRLAEVGGALETIRLDLLRLNAGAGDVRALTAELRAAEEFGRAVGRVVEAKAEVEAIVARERTSH
jgi:eukaryotic-like serine/threonine-protein kinase